MDCDLAWESFLKNGNIDIYNRDNEDLKKNKEEVKDIPKCNELYISTKTKIGYLDSPIDLGIFWKIPLLNFCKQDNGIIKKQIKLTLTNNEDIKQLQNHTKDLRCVSIEKISYKQINKDTFKDVRKISIGLSNKDITKSRSKKKGAFYNCFVLIMRLFYDNQYREVHIKVFNTGKLEIPGIKDSDLFKLVIKNLTTLLSETTGKQINYIIDSTSTVLVNSNFNCNYYIRREKLLTILKEKYNLNTSYDPCSYPGIICKFYYNRNVDKQDGKEPLTKNEDILKISCMIFRTGSILIVGKCKDNELYNIYDFFKHLLETEYNEIYQISSEKENKIEKKVRKKYIIISS
jgi:TATA-box binding protein (TBP) (component of TFIID and TFIIIB)